MPAEMKPEKAPERRREEGGAEGELALGVPSSDNELVLSARLLPA